jgi:uncharacterized protein YndB with AHSA1/START domain
LTDNHDEGAKVADEEQFCRDEAVIPAPPERVWEVLGDLGTWGEWWNLVSVVPLGPTLLAPGVRFRFEGQRPGRPPTGWTVEVLEMDAPRRIEFAYVDGDLIGRTAWELEPVEGGTRAAYVYRGVHATSPGSGETFARYGTRLHSVAMQVDALAGLARFVRGEPLDADWRADIRARMDAGVAALD